MIGKHVDVIAIALLLGGAALYSGARQLALVEVVPYKRMVLSQAVMQRVHRAISCSRSSRTMNIARSVRVTTD